MKGAAVANKGWDFVPGGTTRDYIEKVRAASDIVDVVGGDVQLVRHGNSYKGLSPFNEEANPSFVVWPESQRFCDYSAGGDDGGDVFAYVQLRDGITFREALNSLAVRAGLAGESHLCDLDEEALAEEEERRSVRRLHTIAALYYHRILPNSVRQAAYRKRYGFSDATVDELKLGWADGGLSSYMTGELGVAKDELVRSGLASERGGQLCDFFQDRLVFPYWRRGEVVYFIGRRTDSTPDHDWEKAKYKKLPTGAPSEGRVSLAVTNDWFYNEDAARGADLLLVTEGVTDCIAAAQAGVACISPVTTRFKNSTVPRLLTLAQQAGRVVVCNDSEDSGAGERGALETAQALVAAGVDARLVDLPRPDGASKLDLNEYLRDNGGKALRTLMATAMSPTEFLLSRVATDLGPDDLQMALKPVLAAAADLAPIAQERLLGRIAKKFSLTKSTVKKALATASAAVDAESAGNDGSAGDPQSDALAIELRGAIREDLDHYTATNRDGVEQRISSFQFEPTERISAPTGDIIVGDVTTDNGRLYRGVRLPPEAFHSKRDLIRRLPSPDMQWTGTDDNVQGLLRLLAGRDVPRKVGVIALGRRDGTDCARWIAPDGVVGPHGAEPDAPCVWTGNDQRLARVTSLPETPMESVRSLAARVLPLLMAVNTPSVMLPALGWFIACLFKPQIMRLLGHFPIFWIWGTRGSGKTSLITDILWPLVGVRASDHQEPFSATQTPFAMITLLASSTSVPVFLDEYRPDDMTASQTQRLHRLLRSVYGGETDSRGRPEQTVTDYHLTAPVCVGGEARPEDAALLDRIVSVTPDANTINESADFRSAHAELKHAPLAELALPLIKFSLQADVPAALADARTQAEEALLQLGDPQRLSWRCRDNLLVVAFGLNMFRAFAEDIGVAGLPQFDLHTAFSAVVDDVMDGERGAKTALDHFVETCSAMAHNGDLEEEQHWVVIDGVVCIHLRSAWEQFLAHGRRTGRDGLTGQLGALRRMLKESRDRGGYVKDTGKTVSLGKKRLRTIAIDLAQAGEHLDIDGFQAAVSRSWGGVRVLGERTS